MPRKSDNTLEIIKKMGYSSYYINKVKSIKNRKQKEKVFMNLISKYAQYHNLKCDLKINCKRIQRGGSKATDKAFDAIISIISQLQKSNLNSLASTKLYQSRQDSLNERNSAKDIEIADYKKKVEKLRKEIEKYNIDNDELKRLHSLAKKKIENEMEQSKNLSEKKYSNLLEKHENALGTHENKLSQLTNSKQKQETLTQLKISELKNSKQKQETLTQLKINELKKFKYDTYQINLITFLSSFQSSYLKFSILKNKFIICKLIKDFLLKRKDIKNKLQYENKSPILNFTTWFERLDIFNENLVPMKEYQNIVDKCCFIFYDLIEKYGIDINDPDYQFVKVDNKFKGYHEIATDLIRYQNNNGDIIEAKFEDKKVQGIQPNDTTLDSFSSIINNIKLLNDTIKEIKKHDLDFLNLVIVNTLQVIECTCTSPCNYTWETYKKEAKKPKWQPWCRTECKKELNHMGNDPGTKNCAPIDNPTNTGRYASRNSKTTGSPVHEDYYLEVIKGVSRKGGEPVYYIGNSKIPYAAPTRKKFCLKNLEKRTYLINCDDNQKQTIREFLKEKQDNTMLYLNKIERSFLTVFDDSANKTKKHNPKELQKREQIKQQPKPKSKSTKKKPVNYVKKNINAVKST